MIDSRNEVPTDRELLVEAEALIEDMWEFLASHDLESDYHEWSELDA